MDEEQRESNLNSKQTTHSTMPEYGEIAAGYGGAFLTGLVVRGAKELDKTLKTNTNPPIFRADSLITWGVALGSALGLLWKGRNLKSRHPKIYEGLKGAGHGATALSLAPAEEQITGVKTFSQVSYGGPIQRQMIGPQGSRLAVSPTTTRGVAGQTPVLSVAER